MSEESSPAAEASPGPAALAHATRLLALDPHQVSAPGLITGLEALIDARNAIDHALARWVQAADVSGATVDECGRTTPRSETRSRATTSASSTPPRS